MSEVENAVEAPKTRKPRGPRSEHTAGSLSSAYALVGQARFAELCREHASDDAFQKALRMLARAKPELAALAATRESGRVGRVGLFVSTAAIGALTGDTCTIKVEGDAIVIRKA